MCRPFGWMALWYVVVILAGNAWGGEITRPERVVVADGAAFAERLAAREVRRYFYLCTGRLLPLHHRRDGKPAIVVGVKNRPCVRELLIDVGLEAAVRGLQAQQYYLKTVSAGGGCVLVVGGDPAGTLYGAYRLVEHMGVRFYLHGDVLPDRRRAATLTGLEEEGRPLFSLRGIQPFHDFPEGPDWWDLDTYKAILAQLPKLRMNFFGLHTYPEGPVGPEPTVWIGPPGEVNPDGTVQASYPSRHFTTSNVTAAWGYRPAKTSDYWFGAAALYDRDDYGADYMRDTYPWNEMSPEEQNALFARMGQLLNDAFRFARLLGVRTCVGTETPLVIPAAVRRRLEAAGKDPADPAVVREVYRGIFLRIMRTHPLDYYWFWTPEGWTWRAVKQEQIDATLADLRAAIAAWGDVAAPFTLATCGWVLGPPQEPALFDGLLPKEIPMSCINRQVGHAPVEPGFAEVKGRPKWAIPWLEDDPALTSPQLWVGRMRKDAADALAYGCTGLMGIHWRTRILGPNVAALAQAAWDQSRWNPALGADRPEPQQPEGPIGGKFARFPHSPMAGTDEDPIYQTVRYDVGGYRIDLPNGRYTVTLKFCEPAYAERGRRVFDVRIQDKPVIEQLDIFARVGKDHALDFTFPDVAVTDGRLRIDFGYRIEFPCIAAIVIEGPAGVRKINCGGPAWEDYQADWPASDTSGRRRFLPCKDFYLDWAASQFGAEAAGPIADLFTRLDGRLPRPSDWVHGPGGLKPDPRPWEQVAPEYAFVDQLAALRRLVQGPGNLERFDYWLGTFQAMRAMAQVRCTWARFNQAMAKVKAEKDPAARKQLARQSALPLRRQLVEQVAEVHRHLLATVSTYGGLGNITNWQQHILPELLTNPGEQLAEIMGQPLPPDAMPWRQYQGPPRLFLPAVRTCLLAGEPLRVKIIALGQVSPPVLYWRPMGQGAFTAVAAQHVARGVYRVELPAETATGDIEYYIEAEGRTPGAPTPAPLRVPATAPQVNHTAVVIAPDG